MGFRTVRIIFVSTLFLSVLAVSCKKESFNTGAGVTFSMSNRGIDTKAEYGDLLAGSQKIQMIDWKTNDRIAICCDCAEAESPVASKQGPVVYKVDGVSSKNNQSIASVVVGEENKFIQWGGNHQHTFYCVYPAPEETGTVTKTFSSNVVTGSIPETQSQQDDLKPYMLLYGKSVYDAPYEKVDVDFYPLTTCIDFKITFDVWMKVTDIALVSSDGKKLSGGFSYNLDSKVCTSTDGADTVKVSYEAGKECTTSTELSFKLFVKPCDDIVVPYFAVKYIDEEGDTRFTKTQLKYKEGVSDESFKFVKSHKTNVTGIIVKEGFKITNFDGMELCPWSEETLDLPVEDELKTVFSLNTDSIVFSNEGERKTLEIIAYNYYERFPDVHYPVNSSPVVTCSDASWVTIGDPVQQDDDKTKWIVTMQAEANIGRSYDDSTADFDPDRNNSKETAFDLSFYVPSTGETSQEQKTANCYVVNAPGWYKFPAKYGTGGNVKIDGVTYYGAGDVSGSNPEVTWQDADVVDVDDISFSDKYIFFHVAPSKIKQENALISLKNNSTITWSWHIWVTPKKDFTSMPLGYCEAGGKQYIEYKNREGNVNVSVGIDSKSVIVSQNKEKKENGTIPVTKSCTYYQWGRNIPFCQTSKNFVPFKYYNQTGQEHILYAETIPNPKNIYAVHSGRGSSWLGSLIDGMWTSDKTVFDPCPVGLKVPSSLPTSSYEMGQYYVTGTQRNTYSDASLTYITTGNYYWTTQNKKNLDVSGTFTDEQSYYFAWNALPIIPVQTNK